MDLFSPVKKYPARAATLALLVLFAGVEVRYAPYWFATPEGSVAFEYGNIAKAMVEGRGFADPFAIGTGPTAWMPPLYPLLIAGVYALFGVKTLASLTVLMVIQLAAIAAGAGMLFHALGRSRYARLRILFLPILAVFLLLVRREVFVKLGDVWLNFVLLAGILLIALSLDRERPLIPLGPVLLIAAIVPLMSPVLLAVLGTVCGFAYLRGLVAAWNRQDAISSLRIFMGSATSLRLLAVVALTSLAVGTWMARNAMALGGFIPVKSNFWYEFYQANVVDHDGIPSMSTMQRTHPSRDSANQDRYVNLGERAFVQSFRAPAVNAVHNDPGAFACKIANRARNALLFTQNWRDLHPWPAAENVSTETIEKLVEAKVARVDRDGTVLWISLDLSEERFVTRLRASEIPEMETVLAKWKGDKEFKAAGSRGWRAGNELATALLPFLAAIVALLHTATRNDPVFRATVAVYFLYLAPYILISHLQRYQLPLFGLQALLVFFALAAVLGSRAKPRG